MKTKKFHKKLMLNKRTIADLGGNEMSRLKGGKILPHELTYLTCLGACPTHYLRTCITWACDYSCPCEHEPEDDPMI